MPDLTLEPRAACASHHTFVREVQGTEIYTVRHCELDYAEANRQMCQTGWTCTCKAFQFSKDRRCKHIRAVEDEFCGWDQNEDGQKPVDNKCPKCGGPVIRYMMGV